jgi:beta-lactamase superfamily II metal-dependent hydrolase
MARITLLVAIAAALAAASPGAQNRLNPLEIWVIDVEGGKAALFVSPTGQTALVDSGWPGFDGRDPDRIMAAVADAGVKQIDYMLSTHYHVDHVGGLQELARRIPIVHYVDHGPTVEGPLTSLREQVQGFWEAYGALHGKAKRIVVKPGDRMPITGLEWRIVTSAGNVLTRPMSGAGKPNPACTDFTPRADKSNLRDPDDAQSVGSLITLGAFRAIDLGDLWWTRELELICPRNPIGTVSLFFATSHGADASNALPLVHGLQPRVAVVQNGTRKGGAVDALRTLRSSPGLEDVWQMHWSYNAAIELNSAGVYIANIDEPATIAAVLTAPSRGAGSGRGQVAAAAPVSGAPSTAGTPATPPAAPGAAGPAAPVTGPSTTTTPPAAPGAAGPAAPAGQRAAGRGSNPAPGHSPAYWLKIAAQPDGSFTITNNRNGFTKTYRPQSAGRR